MDTKAADFQAAVEELEIEIKAILGRFEIEHGVKIDQIECGRQHDLTVNVYTSGDPIFNTD